jgi:hypothetical protein
VGEARATPGDREIRLALKRWLTDRHSPGRTIEEFWVPLSHERVDVVHVNGLLCAYEIKSGRDDLSRLRRQVAAFDQVFDRLVAVVDRRHLEPAIKALPSHWGVTESACQSGQVLLITRRKPAPNPMRNSAVLLRLLWRSELIPALRELGLATPAQLARVQMWNELLARCSSRDIEGIVRRALLARDLARCRWGSRSKASQQAANSPVQYAEKPQAAGCLSVGGLDIPQLAFNFNPGSISWASG